MPEFFFDRPDKVSLEYTPGRTISIHFLDNAHGHHGLYVSAHDILLVQPCANNAIQILLLKKPPSKK